MRERIDIEPDLKAKSAGATIRAWDLSQRVDMPEKFESPELCLVEITDHARVWKLTQRNAGKRTVDLAIYRLNPVFITADFYDYEGAGRMPKRHEEQCVDKIEDVVQEIMNRYGEHGTIA